ncbi:DOMON-like domain-containing protein [Chamaesiphon sp. GL140_3_metabinner_50]|uniref:DOMON-like domain-containing protein n=1 Tax=Chamaesiphon sp. GL140_3_metabinner_50 TaxID=2970812 RepID=UPI0025FD5DE3|nr:DOMON-like domain-containing protein [Chamaesiphon sp. GL140_3_metabinner_50]
MNEFKLIPFPTQALLPKLELSGRIDRQNELLSIEYQLQGDLAILLTSGSTNAIDPPKALPSRKFELWEATCFEFFIGIPGNSNYWEFNLAPNGDWNVFHLDDYRQGLQNELAFVTLPFEIDRQANSLLLTLIFDLNKIIPPERPLEISVTTVIKSQQHEMSYWALTHPGTEPDFHRRDSFIIKI